MSFAVSTRYHHIAVAVLAAALLVLHGCTTPVDRASHFVLTPLYDETERAEREAEAEKQAEAAEPEQDPDAKVRQELHTDRGPRAPYIDHSGDTGGLESLDEDLQGPPIRLDVNNLPLPVFINEVFGEKLGLSYSLAPALADRTDLVTLRLSDPLPPAALFRTARSVLARYGVAVSRQEGVWFFGLSDEVSTEGSPLLVTGEALPEVPVSHRPVFRLMELKVVRNAQVRGLLQGLFKGQKLEVTEDPTRNAVMLKGPADQVAAAVEAVHFFDRPLLKGRHSLLLRPLFHDITTLSQALRDLLSAQGYAIGNPGGTPGSVILLPMEELEVIVALANDNATLQHIEEWAHKLDRDYQKEIDTGIFIYEVQDTSAANLANLITELYTGTGVVPARDGLDAGTEPDDNQDGEGGESPGESGRVLSAFSGDLGDGRLVVDERRNVLIYRGSGRSWIELRSIIESLDKQVPSVLMDVLLAEVTLNDNQDLGIEWLARNAFGDRRAATFGTLDALDIGGRGFSFTLNSAGQTRAVLNAFYNSNQAVIRSSPKLMVKSGETARIEVGNEIPILTSTRQNQFQTEGDTDVLQQFDRRQTGVELVIEPIVQASGLVDIRFRQNISESQPTGANFLPNILNRTIETSLTLRDGGSVVLGGLISRTSSEGQQGVPWLGRIPILGHLFRTQSDSSSTTELMVMVIPYVIRNDSEAQNVSAQLRERIRLMEPDSEQ